VKAAIVVVFSCKWLHSRFYKCRATAGAK